MTKMPAACRDSCTQMFVLFTGRSRVPLEDSLTLETFGNRGQILLKQFYRMVSLLSYEQSMYGVTFHRTTHFAHFYAGDMNCSGEVNNRSYVTGPSPSGVFMAIVVAIQVESE